MLDRIRFVLHATQHPGNIGAAARAMKNMGLSQLYLVAPERFPHPDAYARAAGADQLLNEAVVVSSLNEALAGCHWVLGTTAQNRSVRLPELAPRQAVDELGPMIASGQEVAIVFGQERSGECPVAALSCIHLYSYPS